MTFALFPIHESHKVIKQINKAIHEYDKDQSRIELDFTLVLYFYIEYLLTCDNNSLIISCWPLQ